MGNDDGSAVVLDRARPPGEMLMPDRLRGTRPTLDPDRLKNQAAEVGARLSDATVRAGVTAEQLALQAKEAALHTKEWAAPRVERAWHEGKKAAAPKIEAAAEKAIPVVDTAHDKLVDEILPKLVAAITAAAGAAAVGADKAREVADAKLTEIAHIAPPKKKRTGAKIFWTIAGLAIVGGVLSALRRRQPATDPWAEDPWGDVEPELAAAADELDEIPPAEEVVAEAAAVAESAAETAEDAKPKRTRTRKADAPSDTAADTAQTEGETSAD